MHIFKHAVLAALLIASGSALAQQVTVPANVQVNWTAPTVSDEGVPLTGTLALTQYQLVLSASAIPPDFSGTPTAVVDAAQRSTASVLQIANGGTVHVRVRACNAPSGVLVCSNWTDEATKPVNVSTRPAPPTNVTIAIQVSF